MKSFKSLALTFVTCLVSAAAHATPRDLPDVFPKTPTCRHAQAAILADARQTRTFNGLGITSWLSAEVCALSVNFETSQKLLAFVDARIAEGKDPTVELVKGANGHSSAVKLLMQVTGPIVAQGVGGRSDAHEYAAPATRRELMVLQDAFTKKYAYPRNSGITMVGISAAMFQPALTVGFNKVGDMRAFLAKVIAAGESPAPIVGRVNGKLVSAPVIFEIVGLAHAQPVGSISN